MKITVSEKGLPERRSALLCVSLFEEDVNKRSAPAKLPAGIRKWIELVLSRKDFKGAPGESNLSYPEAKDQPQRILLTGLGKKKDFSWEQFRRAIGLITNSLSKINVNTFDCMLPGEGEWKHFDLPTAVREASLTYTLSCYQFLEYRSQKIKKEEHRKIKQMNVVYFSNPGKSKLRRELEKGRILGESVNFSRNLVNHPSSYMTPARLADLASKTGNKKLLKAKILNRKEMEKLKMGGLLGVSKGSDQPPKFIVLEYFPNNKKEKPLVFVGKGVTFDTGGISLKPPQGMDQMKYDMAGGAAVIGALAAISRLGIKRNVVGLIPATENMPGGHAYKPGDILKMMNGKTVEVLNTDAEGRLILADALAYAQKYEPAAIIDLATLTGACLVALGHEAIGLMSNSKSLTRSVSESAVNTHERVWELPLWEEYGELIKSSIADIQNIGGRNAGTITAAAFLKEFVSDTPWVHLDIAGTAWADKPKPYQPKGATGVGVRLLTDLVSNWKNL